MNIGELCNRDVVIASQSDSIVGIAQLMRKFHVGTVVVVEGGEAQGIITDRDIVLEIIAEEVPLDGCTASDIMSQVLVTVPETTGIYETLQIMKSKGVRRIPVVDNRGGLAGIFSSDDIIEFISEQMGDLVSLMKRELRSEEAIRE